MFAPYCPALLFATIANLNFWREKTKDIMEERTLKNANNYLNTNIYPYLETSGGQS